MCKLCSPRRLHPSPPLRKLPRAKLQPTAVRSRVSYFQSDTLLSLSSETKFAACVSQMFAAETLCRAREGRSVTPLLGGTLLSHTLTLQQSQCSWGLPVTLPTSVPFKFGLHVKVLHVQDQIHVVLSAQVRARGGIHTELEKGPSRKSSLRGPWQKAQGADRGRPERPLQGRCLPFLRGQNSAVTRWL